MKPDRRDFYFWRWHFIVRGYKDRPQYGILRWSAGRKHWCVDIWLHRTLYSLTTRYRETIRDE